MQQAAEQTTAQAVARQREAESAQAQAIAEKRAAEHAKVAAVRVAETKQAAAESQQKEAENRLREVVRKLETERADSKAKIDARERRSSQLESQLQAATARLEAEGVFKGFSGFTYMQCDPSGRCHLYQSETKIPRAGKALVDSTLMAKRKLEPEHDPGFPLEFAPYHAPDDGSHRRRPKIQAYVDLPTILRREAYDWRDRLMVRWKDPNLYVAFAAHQLQTIFDDWQRDGLVSQRAHVSISTGPEISKIHERVMDAFYEADGKSGISDATLQTWRNALGGPRQQRVNKLVFPFMVPSVHSRRAYYRRETFIEWEGWDDSGEVDATFAQPNGHMHLVASRVASSATPTFDLPIPNRAALVIDWEEDWGLESLGSPASCSFLPELVSEHEHQSLYERVRRRVERHTGFEEDLLSRYDGSVVTFQLWTEWPLGAYPCCEGRPQLRVRIEFAGADAELLAAKVYQSTAATSGVRSAHRSHSLRCSFSYDGRRWRRLDLPEAYAGGTGGRTMWGFRCDAWLKHIARSPHSSRSWGEKLGGDGFDDWDAATWELWRIVHFENAMVFGSDAERQCHGWPVRFDSTYMMALDASLQVSFVRASDRSPVRVPDHINNNARYSIGCGSYAPNCVHRIVFKWSHPKRNHDGRPASATFYCDATGAGVGIRDMEGGSGYFPRMVSAALDDEAVPRGGHRCLLTVVLEPPPPRDAATCSAGRAIAHLRLLSSKGYQSYTIGNITARRTFETSPPLTPCQGWPGVTCYYPIRPLRAVITPRPVRMDTMMVQLSAVGAIACSQAGVCTEHVASFDGLLTGTGDMKMITELKGTVKPNHKARIAGTCTQDKPGARRRDHRSTCRMETVAENDLRSSAAHAHRYLRVKGRTLLQWIARLLPLMRACDKLKKSLKTLWHKLKPSAMPQARLGSSAFVLPDPVEMTAEHGASLWVDSQRLGGLVRGLAGGRSGGALLALEQQLGNLSKHAKSCVLANDEANGPWDHTLQCLEMSLHEVDEVSNALGRQGVGGSGALHCATAVRRRVCRAEARARVTNARVPPATRPQCWPPNRNFQESCGHLLYAVNPGDSVFYLENRGDRHRNNYGVNDRCNGFASVDGTFNVIDGEVPACSALCPPPHPTLAFPPPLCTDTATLVMFRV